MKDRICVFVDGENLRKSIEAMFPEDYKYHDYLPPKANWKSFFSYIINEVSSTMGFPSTVSPYHLRTYWYVIAELEYNKFFLESKFDNVYNVHKKLEYFERYAKSHIGDTKHLQNPEEKGKVVDRCRKYLEGNHQELQNRLLSWKTKQSRVEFEVPRLQFQRFGYLKTNLDRKSFKGGEKGVDVKLATDLILLKDNYDTAIIVSGDADYIPAAGAIKNFGKTVVTVSFKDSNGGYLPGGARQLTNVTDYNISVGYENMKAICGY